MAVREALAFRQARHTRIPGQVENKRNLMIAEGLASHTQTALAAPSEADAIARALELLAGAEDGQSFVRTFSYTSGPRMAFCRRRIARLATKNARRRLPGGGSGLSDSRGAVVIPDAGTVYFHAYRMTGQWGALEADSGALISTDGRTRRLPAPVRGDSATIFGDGWTLMVAPGWVIREAPRRGDFEVVRRQR
jgi:hypothetical protein